MKALPKHSIIPAATPIVLPPGTILAGACTNKSSTPEELADVIVDCVEMYGNTATLRVKPDSSAPSSFTCMGWGLSPTQPTARNVAPAGRAFFALASQTASFIRVDYDSGYKFRVTPVHPTVSGSPVSVQCLIDAGTRTVPFFVNGSVPVALAAINLTAPHPYVRPGADVTVVPHFTDNYGAQGLLSPVPAVTWSSSALSVATVTSGGTVTAVSPGSTTITATNQATAKHGSIVLKVPVCTSVTLRPSPPDTITLTQGVVVNATLSCDPVIDTSTEQLSWTSSSPTVATVSGTGRAGTVQPLAVGTTTITATEVLGFAPKPFGTTTIVVVPTHMVVSIVGPTTVPRNSVCRWSAAPSGGTPPYTYTWSPANQSTPANGKIYTHTIPGTGPFSVNVVAHDAAGNSASADLFPTLQPPGSSCPKG